MGLVFFQSDQGRAAWMIRGILTPGGNRIGISPRESVRDIRELAVLPLGNNIRGIGEGEAEFTVRRIASHVGCRMHCNANVPNQQGNEKRKAKMSASKRH